MKKSISIVSSVALALAIAVLPHIAFAEHPSGGQTVADVAPSTHTQSAAKTDHDENEKKETAKAPHAVLAEGIRIEMNGEVKIAGGIIKEVESHMLHVGMWGMEFKVDASKAKIVGGTGTASLALMKVGEKVSVEGHFNMTTGVIMAEKITNDSLRMKAIEEIQAKIKELLHQIEELQKKLQTPH